MHIQVLMKIIYAYVYKTLLPDISPDKQDLFVKDVRRRQTFRAADDGFISARQAGTANCAGYILRQPVGLQSKYSDMKYLIILLLVTGLADKSNAQIDTTSYPEQRKQILDLLHHSGPGTEKSCGDLVAVGPKGDISFSRKEWAAAQAKEQVVFRSLMIMPGSEVVRVYDGTTAVVNFLADVALTVAGKEVNLKVRRLEVYHKTAAGWCMVAGQGTQVDETLFPVR